MCLSSSKAFNIVILVSSSTYTKMCSISGRAYEKLVTLIIFGNQSYLSGLWGSSFSFLFFKSLIIIRTKRRKANPSLQQNQVTVSQIPVNQYPFKRNSLYLLQRKVVLMVTMSTVPSMIPSLWTLSVRVWRYFQQMPENWKILSLPHHICWIEQVS